jgi:hypothetical protein
MRRALAGSSVRDGMGNSCVSPQPRGTLSAAEGRHYVWPAASVAPLERRLRASHAGAEHELQAKDRSEEARYGMPSGHWNGAAPR